jgi:hypothetical protein
MNAGCSWTDAVAIMLRDVDHADLHKNEANWRM